jgi:hypothetical protein
VLSDRERRRLHEIEVQLRLTDPRLVRRFAALAAAGRVPIGPGGLLSGLSGNGGGRSVHRSGPLPSTLLGLSLLVLLVGAVAVSVPVVIAGIVLAALSLGVAATTGPRAQPGTA